MMHVIATKSETAYNTPVCREYGLCVAVTVRNSSHLMSAEALRHAGMECVPPVRRELKHEHVMSSQLVAADPHRDAETLDAC